MKKLIRSIIKEQIYKDKLEQIAIQLSKYQYIDIYTDGSLKNLKDPNCRMGVGWITGNNKFMKQ